MHSKLNGNVVHHGVELLLLVSMLFLLAIHQSLLILEGFLYTSLYSFCISKGLWLYQIDTSYYPFLKLAEDCAEHRAPLCHFR